jgi:hypothetical protein
MTWWHPRIAALRGAVCCLAVTIGVTPGSGTPGIAAEPAVDIARAIAQLSAPQFARREAASRSLVAAGRPAIEPLVAAIDAGDVEVAGRGVDILRELLAARDVGTATAAERSLEQLAERGTPPARALAHAVLGYHHADLADQARATLEAAGAVFAERVLAAGDAALGVEIAAGWQGDRDAWRLLPRLSRISWLSVQGVPLDDEALAVLGRMRSLKRLDLFGTGATAAAVAALEERLPGVTIDVRRGGRLGVSSNVIDGPCEITHVQPGSAAERAGVRVGDVIAAVDGEPIAGFSGLTERVSRSGPGEALGLRIARPRGDGEPERIECRAVLDAW